MRREVYVIKYPDEANKDCYTEEFEDLVLAYRRKAGLHPSLLIKRTTIEEEVDLPSVREELKQKIMRLSATLEALK